MDWIRVIEILFTSITSIIVALVGAGFFKRYNDKKYSAESKGRLLEQIKKDEIVHLAIRDVRRRYEADRIYVCSFTTVGHSIQHHRCKNCLLRMNVVRKG